MRTDDCIVLIYSAVIMPLHRQKGDAEKSERRHDADKEKDCVNANIFKVFG